jgi:hypothetical protein
MVILDVLEPGEARPFQPRPETPFAAPTPVFRASNREEDETYGGIVAVLNPNLRIIRGSCGIQWILQRRKNPARWLSIAYCGTKEGLLLRIKDHLQPPKAKQILPLSELPNSAIPKPGPQSRRFRVSHTTLSDGDLLGGRSARRPRAALSIVPPRSCT